MREGDSQGVMISIRLDMDYEEESEREGKEGQQAWKPEGYCLPGTEVFSEMPSLGVETLSRWHLGSDALGRPGGVGGEHVWPQ